MLLFEQSILDFVDQLTLAHLRKLFSILGQLAYTSSDLDLVLQVSTFLLIAMYNVVDFTIVFNLDHNNMH